MRTTLSLLCLLLVFKIPIGAQSSMQEDQGKPTIALLGTFHFAGSSSDAISLKVDDLTTEKRQKEIEELVNDLAKYKPTKVIVEYKYGNHKLDSLYQLYLKGTYTLNINERQQIGFRLASKMGHKHIYPADEYLDLPFDKLMAFLQENGQMDLFQNLMTNMQVEVMDVWQKVYGESTLKEFFVFINSDKYDAMNKNAYLEYINKMGAEDNYIGSEVVSKWWERNFKIMRNIDTIVEPGDRAFVLFGQGHTAILKDLYKTRSDVKYVDLISMLKD